MYSIGNRVNIIITTYSDRWLLDFHDFVGYINADYLLSWLTSTGSLGPGSRWLQKGVALASELLAAGG